MRCLRVRKRDWIGRETDGPVGVVVRVGVLLTRGIGVSVANIKSGVLVSN